MDYTRLVNANDDPFFDVQMALLFVRRKFKQKVFVIGNSAGGLLASYAAAYSLADYVLLMNPVTCIDTWFDDFDATPELCEFARNTKVMRSLTGRGLCYTNSSFAIPVYLVFPANDWIVPRSQWTKLISTLPSCADDFGFHGNAMTYVGGCFSPIAKWMKAAMNVDVSPYTYAWNAFLDEIKYVTQMAVLKLASKDIYCNNNAL
jgi:acetyl esterase/lipase